MPVRSGSPDRVFVGIDDTDMPGTPGTGRIARRLAESLRREALGRELGVTRHQLFEGPGVPKTSHNSAAAIVLEAPDAGRVMEHGERFLLDHHASGSDPGIAVLVGRAPATVLAFARRTQREVVTRREAERLAGEHDIPLAGLSGTRDGVIGALAAVALCADGGDGRFVGLPGIRALEGRMRVGDILESSGIASVVVEESGAPLGDERIVDTGGWVRPRLIGHLPVMVVRRERGEWVHADARPHRA
jgi:hypothetical protein